MKFLKKYWHFIFSALAMLTGAVVTNMPALQAILTAKHFGWVLMGMGTLGTVFGWLASHAGEVFNDGPPSPPPAA